jgi:hypothetical protein
MPLHHVCAATTLTSWHLLVTFCSLHVAQWVKLFEHKPFDSRTVMGFGILNGVSIGLLNLSLGFNSVGFYQVNRSQLSMCSQNWIDQVQDAIEGIEGRKGKLKEDDVFCLADDKACNHSMHCVP